MRRETMVRRRSLVTLLAVIAALFGMQAGPAPPAVQAARSRLFGLFASNRTVTDFRISPDGRWVVYRGDQRFDEGFELFVVAPGVERSIRLNLDLEPGTRVEADFQISPDSRRVVYRARHAGRATVELYSVPVAGGTPSRLSLEGLASDRRVADFAISPDGDRVVYRANQETVDSDELFGVPIGDGEIVRLSRPLSGGADVSTYRMSPDSRSLVYQTGGEIYSVPLAGDYRAAVSITPPGKGASYEGSFAISADSSRVVYKVDDTSNVELYAAPLAGPGSAAVKLTTNRGSFRGAAIDFALSPDGARVVFLGNLDGINRKLYSVPIAGGEADVRLLSATGDTGEPQTDFVFTPGGGSVLYRADHADSTAGVDLWAVPADGSQAPRRLNDELFGGRNVTGMTVGPEIVVYRADMDVRDLFALYSVRPDGGAPLRLSGPGQDPARDVEPDVRITPDGASVVFRADLDSDEVLELYSAPTRAAEPPTPAKISGQRNPGGGVQLAAFGPSSDMVYFLGDLDIDGVDQVYVADVAPVQVSFAGDLTVSEEAGVATLVVRLSRLASGPVSVPYRVSGGTATAGVDFSLPAGPLVIPAGSLEGRIPLTLLVNGAPTLPAQTVELSLGTPTDAALGGVTRTVVTITDAGHAAGQPPWLALLYLAGDDLAPGQPSGQVSLTDPLLTLRDRLDAMPYNGAVRIVALYDGNREGDTKIYVREPEALRDITEEVAASAIWPVAFAGPPGQRELNTGSPTTLRAFVNWGRAKYAGARHTMLAIVNHGGGWAPDFADPPGQPRGGVAIQAGGWRGMAIDVHSGGGSLSTRDTGEALGGLGRFDVLFFDACLMGMLESAYEVRDAADYYIAGQNLLFADLPYHDYLANGAVTGATTPLNLATRIVARYNGRVDGARNPFTIAAIDLTRLGEPGPGGIAGRIDSLAALLLEALPAKPDPADPLAAALRRAHRSAQQFDYDNSLTISTEEGYVDLRSFVGRLAADQDPAIPPAVREEAGALASLLDGPSSPVVALNTHSGVYNGAIWDLGGARGLSIFLPLGEQDYRPTRVDPLDASKPTMPERQLTYYADPNQLALTRAAPKWAELLIRLESAVPSIRAPGPLRAAPPAPGLALTNPAPFWSPFPLEVRGRLFIPQLTR